ncbi:Hypothetical predicted protein [Cloeon dipterum]|uniref:EF-hand domain-containing protein n=1 Tax=Cloeon dipterum TaxID=197152 RepID=A0A8S1CMD1_9INSE|nr:Hypothetical predicted protein [Cloeon dipterum]
MATPPDSPVDDIVFELEPSRNLPKHRPVALEDLCRQTKFTRQEIRVMYRGFKQECPEGLVHEDAFKDIYAKFFPHGNSSLYAHYVFKAFDVNSNGAISFRDLLVTLSTLLRGSIYEKLRWTFKLYDINGDGCITRSELADIVVAIHELMGRKAHQVPMPRAAAWLASSHLSALLTGGRGPKSARAGRQGVQEAGHQPGRRNNPRGVHRVLPQGRGDPQVVAGVRLGGAMMLGGAAALLPPRAPSATAAAASPPDRRGRGAAVRALRGAPRRLRGHLRGRTHVALRARCRIIKQKTGGDRTDAATADSGVCSADSLRGTASAVCVCPSACDPRPPRSSSAA